MIMIMKVESIDEDGYNEVSCPNCGWRLCDKPKNEKVSLLQIMSENSKMNHVVNKCRNCGNRYLVSTQ